MYCIHIPPFRVCSSYIYLHTAQFNGVSATVIEILEDLKFHPVQRSSHQYYVHEPKLYLKERLTVLTPVIVACRIGVCTHTHTISSNPGALQTRFVQLQRRLQSTTSSVVLASRYLLLSRY